MAVHEGYFLVQHYLEHKSDQRNKVRKLVLDEQFYKIYSILLILNDAPRLLWRSTPAFVRYLQN